MSLSLKTELATFLPLLKEAFEQTQTKMGPLVGDKPEDLEASKPILDHVAKRLAGAERSDEKEDEFAEVIVDSLLVLRKLDITWIFDNSRLVFPTHGTILLLTHEQMNSFAPVAFTARARLFCMLDVIATDTSGITVRSILGKLLPAVVAQSKEYCEVLLEIVKDPIF